MAQRSRDVLLRGVAERRDPALLVTHDLVDAAALADRILMLSPRPARIVAEIEVPTAQRRGDRATALQVAAQLEVAVGDTWRKAQCAGSLPPPASGLILRAGGSECRNAGMSW